MYCKLHNYISLLQYSYNVDTSKPVELNAHSEKSYVKLL